MKFASEVTRSGHGWFTDKKTNKSQIKPFFPKSLPTSVGLPEGAFWKGGQIA